MEARRLIVPALTLASFACASLAGTQTITVHFTNNQPNGGFSTSPVWFAAHNGTFDFFTPGVAASPALEAMAELGVGAGLTSELGASGVAETIATDVVHPQFTPGETASMTLDVPNTSMNRWFSFASMIVPSNDFFIGNDNPLAHPIFDAAGNFIGPVTIQIFGSNAWEGTTEVNDINLGIAFLVGRDAVGGTPEAGPVRSVFSVPANTAYIQSIVGQQTPVYTVTDALMPGDLLATIVVTPAPGGAALLGLAAVFATRRRR